MNRDGSIGRLGYVASEPCRLPGARFRSVARHSGGFNCAGFEHG